MAAQREYIEAELRAAEQALLVEQEALIAAFKFRRKDFLFPEEGPLSRHAYADTVAFLNAAAPTQYQHGPPESIPSGGKGDGSPGRPPEW
jgi:hypothetical protein